MTVLSIVIPVRNESMNLRPLQEEIVRVFGNAGELPEIIYINDGSTDSSAHELNAITNTFPQVKVLHLPKNMGQGYAIHEGIKASTGAFITTLDADLQNDPADILPMLIQARNENRAICGWRKERKDKRIIVTGSRVANWIIRMTFRIPIHDSGCSLRVVPAQPLKELHYFKNYHRYIPLLLHLHGIPLAETVVNHRMRAAGKSKYNIFKSLPVLKELIYIKLFYK